MHDLPADRGHVDEPGRLELRDAGYSVDSDFRHGRWSDLTEDARIDEHGELSLFLGDERSQGGDVNGFLRGHAWHDFLDTASLGADS